MKSTLNRRLSMLTVALILAGLILMARLASFQFDLDTAAYLQNSANNTYRILRDKIPDRGRILDRNGVLLAGNQMQYEIDASPDLITDRAAAAKLLAPALGDNEQHVFTLLDQPATVQNVMLAKFVTADVAQKVTQLDLFYVTIAPLPKRIYPQGSLASQVIGFVGGDGDAQRGYVGVEGLYDDQLAGQVRVADISAIPFEINTNDSPPPGKDIVLTIDRNIQYLAETELQAALQKYNSPSGSILIMDPRNGEILAMASFPTFDPNNYFKADAQALKNPIVSDGYEPGSVFKIVTASAALQWGGVTPDWTYYDSSPYIVGGVPIYNWDRAGHGSQNFVDVLVHSWNIGTSHMAVDVLGAAKFYKGLDAFGVGQRTGIDLEGEESGILYQPGDPYWSDANLATNSFGQALTVTPLQMLSFANAIANNGVMMQPHIRLETIDGDKIYPAIPAAARVPITPQVAKQMTNILVQVVSLPQGEGYNAKVDGYTVAGKTGTAQVPCVTCGEEGYDPTYQKLTFIGYLPADEPRVSILIKFDHLDNFASQTAAPTFADLVQRLVVLMNIPTDAQRQQLKQQGGDTALILNH